MSWEGQHALKKWGCNEPEEGTAGKRKNDGPRTKKRKEKTRVATKGIKSKTIGAAAQRPIQFC